MRRAISGSHVGLVAAIRTVFLGAAWQGCRIHFVPDPFSVIERGSGGKVAAAVRTGFVQTTGEAVRTRCAWSLTCSDAGFPRSRRCCWTRTSRRPTGRRHGPPIPWWTEPGDRTPSRRRPGRPRSRRRRPDRRRPGRTPL
ncbi:transposase [Streptomyces actuosus]|uniref:Transposase n=1 Tax=Streptomyces actuosus TaxID=1885 RepID=A0ABS2VKA1_STRAS|nr:transposase [Streptomyces actuosus]MBN0043517.1 transposase [Streptomyces actuosus]